MCNQPYNYQGPEVEELPDGEAIIWVDKAGNRWSASTMSNFHLTNTIKYLERFAKVKYEEALNLGETAMCMLSGEQALADISNDIENLVSNGWESLLPDSYYVMVKEAASRGITKVFKED